MKKELKKILINVRNGGFITPAISEILELFEQEKGKLANESPKWKLWREVWREEQSRRMEEKYYIPEKPIYDIAEREERHFQEFLMFIKSKNRQL